MQGVWCQIVREREQLGYGLEKRTNANLPKTEGYSMIFVGGGQDYYGETAVRDKAVVSTLAERLSRSLPKDVQIVYGGMPGIPEDFCKSFASADEAAEARILAVVSSEQKEKFLARDFGFDMRVIGETQEKRRLGVVRLEGYKCAIFVQGGQYSTHEIKLFKERGDVPIISLWGSGGASGGTQPYQGWTFTDVPKDMPLLCSKDPLEDPEAIAKAMEEQVLKCF